MLCRFLILLLLMLNPGFAFASFSFGNPLIDAVDALDKAKVRYLLDSGFSVDDRGMFGSTALMRAAYKGDAELVRFFLELGANPNLQDVGGATALHIASRNADREIISILLQHGAKEAADFEGNTHQTYIKRFDIEPELKSVALSKPVAVAAESMETVQSLNVNELVEGREYIDGLPWLDSDSEVVTKEVMYVFLSANENPAIALQEVEPIEMAAIEEVSEEAEIMIPEGEIKSVKDRLQKELKKEKRPKLQVAKAIKISKAKEVVVSDAPKTISIAISGFKSSAEAFDKMTALKLTRPKLQCEVCKKGDGYVMHVSPFQSTQEANSMCGLLVAEANLVCASY